MIVFGTEMLGPQAGAGKHINILDDAGDRVAKGRRIINDTAGFSEFCNESLVDNSSRARGFRAAALPS
jgi:hypothetical protein